MNSNELAEKDATQKIRVGIIEDNMEVRTHVSKFITIVPDMEMVHGFNSIEAYLYYLKLHPDFQLDTLLLDIGLPGMSGLDAIPIILEKNPSIDILMLTTFEEESMILKALCSGAVAYISKKSSLQEIGDAIRTVHAGGSYMSPMIARDIFNYFVRGGALKKKETMLTPRQIEILERLVEGKSYGVIADELYLSVETVRYHLKKLYKVLHVNNKVEAIAMYLRGEL